MKEKKITTIRTDLLYNICPKCNSTVKQEYIVIQDGSLKSEKNIIGIKASIGFCPCNETIFLTLLQ